MAHVPTNSKIYHITHVDNLEGIIRDGGLFSDAEMRQRNPAVQTIGMSEIKRRRLEEIEVSCHPGTMVGEYVPFYFCPRSVMLYVIHCANHPELTFRGGQADIVHLEADVQKVVQWAENNNVRWAISKGNAGARFTEIVTGRLTLAELNWAAIAATDFRDPDIKEAKQAEFLVYGFFPWELVQRVGVLSQRVYRLTREIIHHSNHQPLVSVQPGWYF
jgi:hypothetical protein